MSGQIRTDTTYWDRQLQDRDERIAALEVALAEAQTKRCPECGSYNEVFHGHDCPHHILVTRIVTLQNQLAEAQRRLAKCVEALRRIQRWFGEFPEATLYDGTHCEFSVAYGSNGERDYMRAVAAAALDEQEGTG